MENAYRSHTIGEITSKDVGSSIRLAGWVHVIRDQSKIIFLVLRDYDGLIQCVLLPEHEEAFATAKKVSQESVVSIEGMVVEAKQAPNGIEVQVTSLTVLSASDPELPIPVVERGGNETDQAVRMDYRWLDLRKPEKLLLFKVSTLFEQSLRDFFIQERFLQIHSPKLMSSASESGSEVFEVKYFDRAAYLAQSPQFYKQMAMAAGFERVFEVGPVFRAEPSFTTRHATEFTGLDFEMSFITSHEDVMDVWSKAIAYAMKRVADQYGEQVKKQYNVDIVASSLPFPQVTMEEAKALLAKRNISSEREGDLSPEEERALGDIAKEQYGHEFIFVTEYPASVRPFYHMRKEGNPALTLSFDLIWKGVEITTGAQREHRHDVLQAQAKEKGMNLDSIAHYLDFFRYGCPPHGGAGIGFDRMIMIMLNVESIREATYIYRGVKRLTP